MSTTSPRVLRRRLLALLAAILLPLATAVAIPTRAEAQQVRLTVTPIVTGLSIPWDVTFTPDGTMLYDERGGGIHARLASGEVRTVAADFSDLFVGGEIGLLGMVVDPDYATNRTIYTCQGHTDTSGRDIRVVRWQVNAAYTSASRVGTPLVTGITNTGSNHGGCRVRFDTAKLLYVSTGDAFSGTLPQDLTSLNGKTLRMTREGAPAPGNPFISSPNARTRLIYTYGHRNVQGLALRPGTNDMWSVEQGTDRDDEVNRLVGGRNYGWNPGPSYDQTRPMTDLSLPNVKTAVWSSGLPTLATSGGTWLSGSQWGRWDGTMVVAALKASSLRVLTVSGTEGLTSIESPPELNGTFGRLRSPQLGPDGALYVTTSNGTDDKILRVTPSDFAPGDPRCLTPTDSGLTTVALTTSTAGTTTFGVGTDRAVWSRSVTAGAAWRSLGGIAQYGPAATTTAADVTHLFVVGWEGNLNVDVGTAGRWNGWRNLGGGLTSSPAAVTDGSTVYVFGRGRDNALWGMHSTGSGWSPWVRFGGVLTSAPGAAYDAESGRIIVGVRGLDGRLYELTYDSGTVSLPTFGSADFPLCSAPAYADYVFNGVTVWVYVTYTGSVERANSNPNSTPDLLGGTLRNSVFAGNGESFYLGKGTDAALWAYDTSVNRWRSLGGVLR